MKKKLQMVLSLCLVVALVMNTTFGMASGVLKLPKSVRVIEQEAFAGLENVDVVELPKEVEEIQSRAFADSQIAQINLPQNLQLIAEDAFEGSDDLCATVEAGSYAHLFCLENGLPHVQMPARDGDLTYTLKDGQAVIFSYMASHQDLILPDFLGGYRAVAIGNRAFAQFAQITSVYIPEGYTSIGKEAFEGCTALETVTILPGVTEIGENAFAGCDAVSIHGYTGSYAETYAQANGIPFVAIGSVATPTPVPTPTPEVTPTMIPEITPVPEEVTDEATGWKYRISEGEATITGYAGTETALEIPSELGGAPVTALGSFALADRKDITALTLPASVKRVEYSAFVNAHGLTELHLSEGLESIGDFAFSGANLVKELTIPSTVREIGEYAFNGYYGITTVNFVPGALERIGSSAFSACWGIKEIVLPDGVVSIGDYAFRPATAMEKAYIPASVTEIGADVFGVAEKLTIYGAAGSYAQTYAGENNIPFVESGSVTTPTPVPEVTPTPEITPTVTPEITPVPEITPTMIPEITPVPEEVTDAATGWIYLIRDGEAAITGYAGTETELEIPSELGGAPVTVLGDSALADRSDITALTVPASVKRVEDYAFVNAGGLAKLQLSEGLEYIGDYAFSGANKVQELVIPSTVKEIGDSAFVGYFGITAVNFKQGALERIGSSAFSACWEIREIVIPDGVVSIGDYAFRPATAMEKAYIPASVTEIGADVFGVADKLTIYGAAGSYAQTYAGENSIPFVETASAPTPTPVPVITPTPSPAPQSEFFYVLENGEMIIGGYEGSETSITIPEQIGGYPVTAIADAAFLEYTELTSVTIPGCVKRIGEYAFDSCTSLETLVLAEGIETIGEYAFASCTALKSVSIPSTVKEIPAGAFENCQSAQELLLPAGLESIGDNAFANWHAITVIRLPSGLTAIGSRAFASAQMLESIVIPESVVQIGEDAFLDCGLLTIYGTEGSYTQTYARENGLFFYAQGNPQQTLEPSVTPGPTQTPGAAPGAESDFAFEITAGNAKVTGYTGSEAMLTVPDTLGGAPVTAIAASAFKENETLTHVWLPDSVESIGDDAFAFCRNLQYVSTPACLASFGSSVFSNTALKGYTLPEGLKSIPSWLFVNCDSLTSLTIPESVTTIGNSAFSSCGALVHMVIPENVVSIGTSVFNSCSSLRTVQLPSGLKSMGAAVFDGCVSLEWIEIPEKVQTIGDYAFRNCSSLEYAAFPRDLTSIGEQAFYECSELKKVSLPAGVYSIGQAAFSGCTNLSSVELQEGLVQIAMLAFADCPNLRSIVIPKGVASIAGSAFDDGASDFTIYGYSYSTAESCAEANGYTFVALDDKFQDGDYYYVLEDDGARICIYTGPGGDIAVPSRLGGHPVVAIGENVFGSYSSRLLSVSLPEGVRSIGARAFMHNIDLLAVSLPSTLKTIGDDAFASCGRMYGLTLPEGLKEIGDDAFYDCGQLNTPIPQTVTRIGRGAFNRCTSMQNVTIPAGLTVIETSAFISCGGLRELVIPEGVTTIEGNAFANIYTTSLTLPESLTSISATAFNNGTILNIRCVAGSAAHAFALENDIPFTLAESFVSGNYTYRLAQGSAVLTGYTGAGGAVSLPSEIDGYAVTAVGAGAFANNPTLESLIVPASIKQIGQNAFSGCTALEAVHLGGVTAIQSRAFAGTGLLQLELPDSLTELADYAFENCASLTSIVVGSGLSAIKRYTFAYCQALASIQIPASVRSISTSAFYMSGGFTVLGEAGSAAETFALQQGFGFYPMDGSEDFTFTVQNGEAWLKSYNGISGVVAVPASHDGLPVTAIASHAFRGNTNIGIVVLPATVKAIQDYAFYGCKSLREISLPSGLQQIGAGAFVDCTSLQSVVLPHGLTEIGRLAFAGCTSLAKITIPDTVETFGILIFDDSPNVTIYARKNSPAHSYAVENGLSFVSTGYDLSEFEYKTSDGKASITAYTGSSSEIEIPSSMGGMPVVSIAAELFRDNQTLRSVVLPENVTTIGENAFRGCKQLRTVVLPSTLSSIGEGAFQASGLTSIVIPEGITDIPDNAFNSCNKLSSVTFPSTLRTIGSTAFGAVALTSLVLPGSVETIRNSAFSTCTSLKSAVLPAALKTLGTSAFYGCTELASVTFGGAPEIIDQNTFGMCQSLQKISLPQGVKTIAWRAFYNCGNLEQIGIPASVTTIEEDAFSGALFLNVVQGEAGSLAESFAAEMGCAFVPYGTSISSGYQYVLSGGEATITHYSGLSTKLVIPATLDGYPVAAVGDGAFADNTALTSVSFEEGVKRIGADAFGGCTSLQTIALPQSLVSIGAGAFAGTAIREITLPDGLTAIGAAAFSGCTALQLVMIPRSVTSIGTGAFAGCAGVVLCGYANTAAQTYAQANGHTFRAMDEAAAGEFTFTVANGAATLAAYTGEDTAVFVPYMYGDYPVAAIGANAFSGNQTITRVTLPDTVVSIGDSAFADCTALAQINLPDGLTTLGSLAFSGCTALNRLDVPAATVHFGDENGFPTHEGFRLYCEYGSEACMLGTRQKLEMFYLTLVGDGMPSGELEAGERYTGPGYIISSHDLTGVSFVVTNLATGKQVLHALSEEVNYHSYAINALAFDGGDLTVLPVGRFSYSLDAWVDLDTGREYRHLAEGEFRLVPQELTFYRSNSYKTPENPFLQGSSYTPAGMLRCTQMIEAAVAMVTNLDTGEVIYGTPVEPGNVQVPIGKVYSGIDFSALQPGSYACCVLVFIGDTTYRQLNAKFTVAAYDGIMDEAKAQKLIAFSQNGDNEYLFTGFKDYRDVLDSLDGWDKAFMAIVNRSEILVDELIAWANGKDQGYQTKLYKEQIVQMLEKMSQSTQIIGKESEHSLSKLVKDGLKEYEYEGKVTVKTIKTVLSGIKGDITKTEFDRLKGKYGSRFKDDVYRRMAAQNSADYNSFLKQGSDAIEDIGTAIDVVEFSVEALDILLDPLYNFQNSKLILETLSDIYGDDVPYAFQTALEELLNKYQSEAYKRFSDYCSLLMKTIVDEGIKVATKAVLEAAGSSAMLAFTVISFVVDGFTKVTGIDESVKRNVEFLQLMNNALINERNYKKIFTEAMGGDTSSEKLMQLEMIFNITRQAYEDLYWFMINEYWEINPDYEWNRVHDKIVKLAIK